MSDAFRTTSAIFLSMLGVLAPGLAQISTPAAGSITEVRTIQRSLDGMTLDRRGTHPFHLIAEFKPSFERDKSSHRKGEMEIWWQSPETWRKEFRSGDLTQTVVSIDGKTTQKVSDGYMPSWARELEQALIQPFPLDLKVLEQNLPSMEVRQIRYQVENGKIEQTDIQWTLPETANTPQGRSQIFLTFLNGRLSFSMGTGWSGQYSDYQDFHGRLVARTVKSGGSPEITAKLTLLEDLGNPSPTLFDVSQLQGGTPLFETVALSEGELRQNLVPPSEHFDWPAVTNGPFDGVVWTLLTVDENGAVRDVGTPVTDNPALKEAAAKGFTALKFSPFAKDGKPVQVTARFSERFHTSRPAGPENLDTARNYFNKARAATFAERADLPNRRQATFEISNAEGRLRGTYTEVWIDANNWQRQAVSDSSQVTTGRKAGERIYSRSGPDAASLEIVVDSLNPLPDDDTLTESDYRIRRVTLNGGTAIRVTRALEDADGGLYPTNNMTYWFDDAGHLLQCITNDMQYEGSDYAQFHSAKSPRHIRLLKDQTVVIEASVTSFEDVTASTKGP